MAECTPVQHASSQPSAPERYRVVLIKGGHRWQFRWLPGDEAALINAVAEIARNPAMPFDWADAAIVCRHIAQPFAQARNEKSGS